MIDRNHTQEFLVEDSGTWRIRTQSGSVYLVTRDAQAVWWLGGRNKVNPFSAPLPPGSWQIEPPQPWPPVIGQPLVMLAPTTWALNDPRRIPGGGKITSAVVEVELVAPEEDEDEEDDSPYLSWE